MYPDAIDPICRPGHSWLGISHWIKPMVCIGHKARSAGKNGQDLPPQNPSSSRHMATMLSRTAMSPTMHNGIGRCKRRRCLNSDWPFGSVRGGCDRPEWATLTRPGPVSLMCGRRSTSPGKDATDASRPSQRCPAANPCPRACLCSW